MIEPKELRIGNLIQKGSKIIEVGIGDLYNIEKKHKPLRYKAIPLTEELLLKFGFYEIYKSEFSIRYGIENFYEIEFKWNKTFGWNFYYKTFCIEGIKLVHQLQNLYFALTGEELTFKK